MDKASLLDEQSAAIDRIVEIARDQKVDVVVLAGDLYDRAIPPAPAVELFSDALFRLRDVGAQVVAISGNHDSASRVGFGDRLLSRTGVTVRADVRRAAEPVMITAADGGGPVAIYPIPYLDPISVTPLVRDERIGDQDPDHQGRLSHLDVLDWAVRRARTHRSDLVAGAASPVRSVVVAHAFVTNTARPSVVSDSERELAIGGADQVDTGLFDGFDYVALGHLHGHQQWDDGRVAYSGTPLPYSFSEEHHTKAVRIVDLAADGTRTSTSFLLGFGRPLRTITGELARLLVDPSLQSAEGARVRAILTDRILPSHAMAQLRGRFPHASELLHQPQTLPFGESPLRLTSARVRQASPYDLTVEFLTEQLGDAPDRHSDSLIREAVSVAIGGTP
ncbi:exonuclease SbcCD subunit D [soil metagenome]